MAETKGETRPQEEGGMGVFPESYEAKDVKAVQTWDELYQAIMERDGQLENQSAAELVDRIKKVKEKGGILFDAIDVNGRGNQLQIKIQEKVMWLSKLDYLETKLVRDLEGAEHAREIVGAKHHSPLADSELDFMRNVESYIGIKLTQEEFHPVFERAIKRMEK